ARALERLAGGASLPAALEAAMQGAGRAPKPGGGQDPKPGGLPPASRAAIRDIASRTVRTWGLCRALSARLNQRPPAPAMLALQQVTLAQLLDPVRADATTGDQAIEAAKADPALRHGAGFLNATLRRFLRERDVLVAAAREEPEGRWNFPAWWVDTLRHAW